MLETSLVIFCFTITGSAGRFTKTVASVGFLITVDISGFVITLPPAQIDGLPTLPIASTMEIPGAGVVITASTLSASAETIDSPVIRTTGTGVMEVAVPVV